MAKFVKDNNLQDKLTIENNSTLLKLKHLNKNHTKSIKINDIESLKRFDNNNIENLMQIYDIYEAQLKIVS